MAQLQSYSNDMILNNSSSWLRHIRCCCKIDVFAVTCRNNQSHLKAGPAVAVNWFTISVLMEEVTIKIRLII